MDLQGILVVLHRPSSAENLGAVARVMKNFGLRRLAVVEPPSWSGRPRGAGGATVREDILQRARRTARRAGHLLGGAELHRDLRAALAGATWACGTTSRRPAGRLLLSPRRLAAEVARRSARGRVALVFGEERRGLSDAELELCQAACAIPTSGDYDSMNLAQAAAVVCYELSLAGRPPAPEGPGGGPEGAGQVGAPARHATLEALWERLEALLSGAGYLNPQNPGHILAEWRRLLARAEPTQREAELLLAAARALERSLRVARGRDA